MASDLTSSVPSPVRRESRAYSGRASSALIAPGVPATPAGGHSPVSDAAADVRYEPIEPR